MAIVREAFATAKTSGLASGSATIATWAAGETCVALINWYGTVTLNTVTMAGESNLTILGSPQTGGPNNGRSQWAVLNNVTGTGSKAVTANFSASTDFNVTIWRLSGTDTSGAADGSPAGATGTSTTPSVGITTSVANAAIFAGISSDGSQPSAPGSGYTLETLANAYWYDGAEYDIDVGAAGSKTVDATITSGLWIINALAIKPAGGGTTQALSGSAATGGSGTQSPGHSIGL